MEPKSVGGQWLKEQYNLVNYTMTHSSYIGGNPDMTVTSKGNIDQTYPRTYAVKEENDPLQQIEFYLKYDDLNLDFLKTVFYRIPDTDIAAFINNSPASKYARKIGFYYEFLTDNKLVLDRPLSGNYIELLDTHKYVTGQSEPVTRWRVHNNLLGTRDYCPVVRKTKELEELLSKDLSEQINKLKADYPEDIFRRATNYLYTKETKSSYEIEKEKPSADRTQKFVALLQRAGSESNEDMLARERLIILQNAIVDPRFANVGFRDSQTYVGRSIGNGHQEFHYICPPPQMTKSLMEGIKAMVIKTAGTASEIRATVIAFGFVFIHPFDDGNGRIHRFLIHDVLAHDKKVPQGIIIPVSAHMLNHMSEYDNILEKYSKPLMQRIKFNASEMGQVDIANPDELEGYYRYPELTNHCIYLIRTIHDTIQEDMPKELMFVQRYDEAKKAVQQTVDMPDRMIDLMLTFLNQNKGKLAKRKREEFAKLTDEEIAAMEDAYRKVYEIE
jgi:Fic family protein